MHGFVIFSFPHFGSQGGWQIMSKTIKNNIKAEYNKKKKQIALRRKNAIPKTRLWFEFTSRETERFRNYHVFARRWAVAELGGPPSGGGCHRQKGPVWNASFLHFLRHGNTEQVLGCWSECTGRYIWYISKEFHTYKKNLGPLQTIRRKPSASTRFERNHHPAGTLHMHFSALKCSGLITKNMVCQLQCFLLKHPVL